MKDLIKALTILSKYMGEYADIDEHNPTWCEHDIFHVNVCWSKISYEDKIKLNELGFREGDHDSAQSFRFGSC